MNIRTLALTIIVATGAAATASILAYSTGAPAAVRSTDGGNEGTHVTPPQPDVEKLFMRNGSADACRDAIWPYIPSACLRNADGARAARQVRIILFHAPMQAH